MVAGAPSGIVTASSAEVIRALDEARRASAGGDVVVVFDADGTLWSGDVSEDVFEAAVHSGLLREATLSALLSLAQEYSLPASGTPSQLAWRIFEAYRAGSVPERVVCEMMTWCYAGFSLGELDALGREALAARKLGSRIIASVAEVRDFVRSQGMRAVVVSASPQWVVELGAGTLGFAREDIVAARAALSGGTVQARLAEAVPFGPMKVRAARALFGDALWLGCFGDNIFDLEMLKEALIPVAVRPKPALAARLSSLGGVFVLH